MRHTFDGHIYAVAFDADKRVLYYVDTHMSEGQYLYFFDLNLGMFGDPVKIAEGLGDIMNMEWISKNT